MKEVGNGIVYEKAFQFAVRVVNLYRFLCEDRKEYILSKQVLRSGTSIGANLEEAIGGQSDRDFFAKISVAYKEALETRYWIKLLSATEFINENQSKSLLSDIDEICKIVGKIQLTLKEKLLIANC